MRSKEGEGVVRNKRGERERRAVREGEHTGGQWDQEHSALIVIHDGGHWCRPLIIIHVCSPLTPFITVHRAPLSVVRLYPSRIVNCFASVALHLVLDEVEGSGGRTILSGRRWWHRVSCVRASSHGPWWSCVVFLGTGHRMGLLCASRILLFPSNPSYVFDRKMIRYVLKYDKNL